MLLATLIAVTQVFALVLNLTKDLLGVSPHRSLHSSFMMFEMG